jgi:hypothetical protein
MKTYSIQQEGYRNIKAASPQEAAEKFAKRITKKENLPRVEQHGLNLFTTKDPESFACSFYLEPTHGQRVFLMWDVTSWSFCK